MKFKTACSISCLALLIGGPSAVSYAMSVDDARHLLHRTGFGVTATEWSAIIELDYAAAVDLIVDNATHASSPKPPDWVHEKPIMTVRQKDMDVDQRRELRKKKRQLIADLRRWWLQEMLTTATPLRERMTLFWTNHFVTENRKINAPMLHYQQHELLRSHALGRFDLLTHQIIRDPAMIKYLDNNKNNKNNNNENLARELMELFTLGEGNYTEVDVKEAARCLTGWGLDGSKGRFHLNPKQHDRGNKTVLGQTGRFDGDDLVALLLRQADTGHLIVHKMWREFISDQPDPQLVHVWAREFANDNYRIDNLLKTLFKSDAFRDPGNRGVLVKSPIELYVGLMRPALDSLTHVQKIDRLENLRAARRLPQLAAGAGQLLFDPPNVKGWPGGLKWIDSKTLLMREQAVRNLVVGLSQDEKRDNPYLARLSAATPSRDWPQPVMWMLPAIDVVTAVPVTLTGRRALLKIVDDPTIHLK